MMFDRRASSSINTRFEPLENPVSEAMLSVDDDVYVDCEWLNFAFEVWRTNRDQLVGYVPRVHVGSPGKWTYRHWWTVWSTGRYSIILTKVAFLHHKYFKMYTEKVPKAIHDYIDAHKNCEDIAMQFLVSNVTRTAPVWVQGHYVDIGGFQGIR